MVIEHTFITTLDSNEALSSASAFLQAGGFAVTNNDAFQMGGWTDLEVSRGRKNINRAKNVTECPQQVRVEWDRGRVNVAASIQQHGRALKLYRWSGTVGGQPYAGSGAPKKERAYADLMLAITRSIEMLLAHRLPAEQARAEWAAVEAQMIADARRARRNGWIVTASVFGLLIAFVVFVAIMANR